LKLSAKNDLEAWQKDNGDSIVTLT